MAKKVKRTKTVKRVRWRKVGRGSFRLANRRIIKPNQTFFADPEEIPEAFRDVVVALGPLPKEPEIEPVNPGYVVDRRVGGWYDVRDKFGKRVNEKALKRKDAEALVESLS